MKNKIRIYKPDDVEICLVDWNVIEPYWQRNDFHPLDRTKLKRAYSNLWFDKGEDGCEYFVPGEIWINEGGNHINFTNGRNRTNLLLLYSNQVPIGIDEGIFDHPKLKTSILIKGADLIEYDFPELPTCEAGELLAWDRANNPPGLLT